MKPGLFFRHVLIVAAGAVLLLGVPLARTGAFSRGAEEADAVSSASLILDAPSGEFQILINRALHTDPEALDEWVRFFGGDEDAGIVFEDISCSTAIGDAGALELAKSLQSRLPENQMQIRTEDPTLLLSRAEAGRFDILIVSQEYADIFHAETVYGDEVEVVLSEGTEGPAAGGAEAAPGQMPEEPGDAAEEGETT